MVANSLYLGSGNMNGWVKESQPGLNFFRPKRRPAEFCRSSRDYVVWHLGQRSVITIHDVLKVVYVTMWAGADGVVRPHCFLGRHSQQYKQTYQKRLLEPRRIRYRSNGLSAGDSGRGRPPNSSCTPKELRCEEDTQRGSGRVCPS